MDQIQQSILETVHEISQSCWWANSDAPCPGHIRGLGERINNPGLMSEFRGTEIGSYYLAILDEYESAFSDDWLPFEIIGLELTKAKEFISLVYSEIYLHGLSAAEPLLRAHYSRLSSAA